MQRVVVIPYPRFGTDTLPRSAGNFVNINFHDRFSKYPETSNFMKIRPMGAELFHADEQTCIAKVIVAFRNVSNAPIERGAQ